MRGRQDDVRELQTRRGESRAMGEDQKETRTGEVVKQILGVLRTRHMHHRRSNEVKETEGRFSPQCLRRGSFRPQCSTLQS